MFFKILEICGILGTTFAVFVWCIGCLKKTGKAKKFVQKSERILLKTEKALKQFISRKDVDLIARRTIAGIVDLVVFGWVVVLRYGFWFFSLSYFTCVFVFLFQGENPPRAIEVLFLPSTLAGLYCLAYVLFAVYYSYQEQSPEEASFGKRHMKIKVVTKDNKKISTSTSVGRTLLYLIFFILASIPLMPMKLLPFIWVCIWILPMFVTKDNTTLYDILSQTKVIRTNDSRKVDWGFMHSKSWITRLSFAAADKTTNIKKQKQTMREKHER